MQQPLHRRIRWARLGLVGVLAMNVWGQAEHRETGQDRAALLGKPDSPIRALEERNPELGYVLIGRQLRVPLATWFERVADPSAEAWSLGELPLSFGPLASKRLTLGQPLALEFETDAVILDFELSSSPSICRATALMPLSSVVEVFPKGDSFEFDVLLSTSKSSRLPAGLEDMEVTYLPPEFDLERSTRVYTVTLEPGQTVLLPSAGRGDVIALGIEARRP